MAMKLKTKLTKVFNMLHIIYMIIAFIFLYTFWYLTTFWKKKREREIYLE
jgi:cytochrome bd-type quinol oxidase subunit 2